MSSDPRLTTAVLLQVMAGLPAAAPTLAALAAALGIPPEGLGEVLDRAAAAGLVEPWPDAPDGPSVMLSALAAARLGLRLSPDSRSWLAAGDPEPAEPRMVHAADPAAAAEQVDPDQPEPWEVLAAAEEVERRATQVGGPRASRSAAAGIEDRPPRMRLLLGLRLAWPVEPATPCPGCGGRALNPVTVCLICHRSGIDHLLPRVAGGSRRSRRAGKLKGGLGGKP